MDNEKKTAFKYESMSHKEKTLLELALAVCVVISVGLVIYIVMSFLNYRNSYADYRLEYALKIYQSEDTSEKMLQLVKEYLSDGEITAKEMTVLEALVKK